MNKNTIKILDENFINEVKYQKCFVRCIILTKEHKILLQQRGEDWQNFPDYLSEFGGCIENDETPMQAFNP